MIDKEGNVLPDVAVLGIGAVPLIGRFEIWKIMEEDISLDLLKCEKVDRAVGEGMLTERISSLTLISGACASIILKASRSKFDLMSI